MTDKRVLTAILFALPLVCGIYMTGGRTFAADASDQIIGTWSLVSRQTVTLDGRVIVDPGLSATPFGLLIYDRSGHVAAQLSRPNRTVEIIGEECADAAKAKGAEENARTIFGYDAYFGTYTIDKKHAIITHHLEGALFPGDVGKSISRQFSISGDRLTIKFRTTMADGTPVDRDLLFKRLK